MFFRISDIVDGKSTRSELINPDKLDLQEVIKEPIVVNLTFFKNHDMVHVHFEANGLFTLICDRSLEEFEKSFKCVYDIYFKVSAEPTEDENSAVRPLNLSGNKINILKELRDSILLDIPIKKIHPKYLDKTGQITDFMESFGFVDSNNESEIDPRWDALKKIKSNQNN